MDPGLRRQRGVQLHVVLSPADLATLGAPEEPLRRPRRPPGPRTERLAIAALVLSVVGAHPVGVVLGHLALARIARSGRGGRALALAALVIGYVGIALALVWWVLYFAVLAPVVTLPR